TRLGRGEQGFDALPEGIAEQGLGHGALSSVPGGLSPRMARQSISFCEGLLGKTEPERMLPGHTGRSNVVYDEAGTIYCYDKVSTPMVRRRMAYMGHEAKRGTLKYRCPARHEGWSCPSD